jgi:hypothetical protein
MLIGNHAKQRLLPGKFSRQPGWAGPAQAGDGKGRRLFSKRFENVSNHQ